ncbi:MAG: hypothetical protein QNJ14_11060 [Woeseiaceae bacterium]|nr:hypothetical protein [Woeseiaceae bacterium]
MSNDNTTDTGAPKVPVVPPSRGKEKLAAGEHPERDTEGVEVVSFELADDDFGGDPYNRTGSHCVLKIDENR